jgi:hypothetical protein
MYEIWTCALIAERCPPVCLLFTLNIVLPAVRYPGRPRHDRRRPLEQSRGRRPGMSVPVSLRDLVKSETLFGPIRLAVGSIRLSSGICGTSWKESKM